MTAEVSNTNNFLLYSNDNGEVKVDVLLRDETIWLTINQMADKLAEDTYDSYDQNRIASDAQRPSDIDEAIKNINYLRESEKKRLIRLILVHRIKITKQQCNETKSAA